jgi:hypothetical protein
MNLLISLKKGDKYKVKAKNGDYALVKSFYDALHSEYHKGDKLFWRDPPGSYRIYNETICIIDEVLLEIPNSTYDNDFWISVIFDDGRKDILRMSDLEEIIKIVI